MIHQSTLELLSRVGVKILEEQSLQVLAESGAEVDYDDRIAKIPQRLVDEAIKKAPRSFVLYGRGAKYSTRFEDKNNRVYFHMSGTPGKLLDLETGRSRPATVRDLDGFFRLADALENIDHSRVAVLPTDVSGFVVHAYATLSGFVNATKPLDGWNEGELQSHDTIRMAMEVAGGEEELKRKPRLLAYAQPVSPLQYRVGTTQGLRIYAEHNQPQIIVPWPQGGATAPVTLAGTLMQQNAGVLGAVFMAQLFSPGAPVMYGSSATIMDQSTGCTSVWRGRSRPHERSRSATGTVLPPPKQSHCRRHRLKDSGCSGRLREGNHASHGSSLGCQSRRSRGWHARMSVHSKLRTGRHRQRGLRNGAACSSRVHN